MKKRLMTALAAGGLMATMLPGVVSAAPKGDVVRTCYDAGGGLLSQNVILNDGTPAEVFAYARIMRMDPESQIEACQVSHPTTEGVKIEIYLGDAPGPKVSISCGTAP